MPKTVQRRKQTKKTVGFENGFETETANKIMSERLAKANNENRYVSQVPYGILQGIKMSTAFPSMHAVERDVHLQKVAGVYTQGEKGSYYENAPNLFYRG